MTAPARRTATRAGAPARAVAIRTLTVLAPLAMGIAPGSAEAQTINNVNDCTLLTDPVALRRCVDSFAGRIQRPSDQLLSPSADVARPPAEGRSNDAAEPAAPKRVTPSRPKGWLPEAGKAGGRIQSSPNSIVFDR